MHPGPPEKHGAKVPVNFVVIIPAILQGGEPKFKASNFDRHPMPNPTIAIPLRHRSKYRCLGAPSAFQLVWSAKGRTTWPVQQGKIPVLWPLQPAYRWLRGTHPAGLETKTEKSGKYRWKSQCQQHPLRLCAKFELPHDGIFGWLGGNSWELTG